MLFDTDKMQRGAIISPCTRYRYLLTRAWPRNDGLPPRTCAFVMLNPSTADAAIDDQTIRRCIHYADREGCNHLEVYNLYAYRATDPRELAGAEDPIGPENDYWMNYLAEIGAANLLIAGWGAQKGIDLRVKQVRHCLSKHKVYCLGKTMDGHPRHPSRLSNDQPLELLWSEVHDVAYCAKCNHRLNAMGRCPACMAEFVRSGGP